MFIGLLVTFLTGYVIASNPNMLFNVMSSTGIIVIVLLELALVVFLSARITKMKPITAKISFLLYSFVSGLTFSSIFIIYEVSSILFVFLIIVAKLRIIMIRYSSSRLKFCVKVCVTLRLHGKAVKTTIHHCHGTSHERGGIAH